MIDNDSTTAAQRFATVPISYAGDPSSMEELADRVVGVIERILRQA
jgi:hypothetical protein